tara:strand:- start:405 stop:842 length:438 start_codon:yes stop_codon:yes gene_type:complete
MKKGIAELLKECSEIKGDGSRGRKVEFLQKNSSATMKAVLGFCFDPKIKWLLPEGIPPFKKLEKEHDAQSQLYADTRKLWIFVESVEYHNLNQVKRETLFIEFLENLDPDDADLICHIKDHREIPYRGITQPLVTEAFPNLSKDW